MRIGHIGVSEHLQRFEMKENNICEYCEEVETIDHFIMECPGFMVIRNILRESLEDLGVELNMTNILLGGNFEESKQRKIHTVVVRYLSQSGRMHNL